MRNLFKARKFLVTLGIAVTAALVVVGASIGSQSSQKHRTVAAKKQLVIGFSSYPTDIPVIGLAVNGAKSEAKKLGVKVVFGLAPDAATQATAVENLLAKGVDVIAIDPNDSTAIGPVVKEANAKHVPVIMWIGGNKGGGKTVTLISSDEQAGGYSIANWGFKKLHGKGKVALVQGTKAHEAGFLREKGFRAALKKYPGIKLAAYGEANWQRDKAASLSNDILTRNPDLNMIFALSDEMAKGVAASAQSQNAHPMITGYNGDCETLNNVWKGKITADLYQGWSEIGVRIIDTAVKVGKGQNVPKKIVMPVAVMDKPAMQQVQKGTYKSKNKTLRASVLSAIHGCK